MFYDFRKNINISVPLYIQLYEYIKKEISFGNISFGEKLPSIRSLSANISVSLNTVLSAYSQLETEGYIKSENKKGYFVEKLSDYLFDKNIINDKNIFCEKHNKNYINENVHRKSIDIKIWKKIYNNILFYNEDALYTSCESNGEYKLRKSISEFINTNRGAKTTPDSIIIGAGIQYLLFILCVILKSDISFVAFENPGYDKAKFIFEDFGFNIINIDVNNDGMQINNLEKSYANIVYVSPSHQYPTGTLMPIGKRLKLLSWAKNNNGYIIEDDYDSLIRFESKPVPCLQGLDKNNKVIYLGSFSKLLTPALRISYLVLPHELLHKYNEIKDKYTQSASKMEQLTLSEFIDEGYMFKHLRKIKKIYKEKNLLLKNYIQNLLNDDIIIINADSGLHVVIDVISNKSFKEINNFLLSKNILVALINSDNNVHRLSLSYSGFHFDDLRKNLS